MLVQAPHAYLESWPPKGNCPAVFVAATRDGRRLWEDTGSQSAVDAFIATLAKFRGRHVEDVRAALERAERALGTAPHAARKQWLRGVVAGLRYLVTGRPRSARLAKAGRSHKYVSRAWQSGRWRYKYPGKPFTVSIPREADARGWEQVAARDAAVVAGLRRAQSLPKKSQRLLAIERVLRGVRHREFVVGLGPGRWIIKVQSSRLLPRAQVDHPRVVMNNPDARVRFPHGVHTVILTHNHAAMTPLSGGDVVAAHVRGIREVRAVVETGTWRLSVESWMPIPKPALEQLRDDLNSVREGLTHHTAAGMPGGTMLVLDGAGDDSPVQVAKGHEDEWTQRIRKWLERFWPAVIQAAGAGTGARLEHLDGRAQRARRPALAGGSRAATTHPRPGDASDAERRAPSADGRDRLKKAAVVTWRPCDASFYYRLLGQALFKGAGHKYVRKVWRNGRWNYYYAVHHGGGLGRHEDMAAAHDGGFRTGAAFRMRDRTTGQEGHWHVVHVEDGGDKLHLKHDESGRVVTMTRRELELQLHREHARDFARERAKARANLDAARKNKRTGAAARHARLHEATGVASPLPAAPTKKKPKKVAVAGKPRPPQASPPPKGRDYAGASYKQLKRWAKAGDATAAAHVKARQDRVLGELADFARKHKEGLSVDEQRQREGAAKKSADKRRKLDKQAEALKRVADAQEQAAKVEHKDVGEHVWGTRADRAAMRTKLRDAALEPKSRAEELKKANRVSKKEVFGAFSIHEHVANGGTVGGWVVKAWLHKQVAASHKNEGQYVIKRTGQKLDAVDSYLLGCKVVAKTLEACRTPQDVKEAILELNDWGRQFGGTPPQDWVRTATRDGRDVYEDPVVMAAKFSLGKKFRKVLGGVFGDFYAHPADAVVKQAEELDAAGTDVAEYVARQRGFKLGQVRDIPESKRQGGRNVPGVTDGRVTGEAVAARFKLVNIQYGNWMSNADRDQHLRAAAGGLADLADLLGVSDAAVSVGGRLALAFGARGKGKASAHYEPGRGVINLTKFRGGGTLAHEWGHFLDNMAAGAASLGSRDTATLPPRAAKAMDELKAAVGASSFYRHARAIDGNKRRAYWTDDAELFARLFESWAEDKLHEQGRQSTYLVHGTRRQWQTWVQVQEPTSEAANEHRARVTAAEDRALAAFREAGVTASRDVLRNPLRLPPELQRVAIGTRKVARALREVAKARATPVAMQTVQAQPYPQGDERKELHRKLEAVLGALRSAGVLGKLVKSFLHRFAV